MIIVLDLNQENELKRKKIITIEICDIIGDLF
jgi:hypothetical protein